MKMRTPLIAAALLIPLAVAARADDHLFEARQHGLGDGSQASSETHAFTTNPAGRGG